MVEAAQKELIEAYIRQRKTLSHILSGRSALDIDRLRLNSKDEIIRFLKGYGFDPSEPSDRDFVWLMLRRSLHFIRDEILNADEKKDLRLKEFEQIDDILDVFHWASHLVHPMHHIAQAAVRVMHAFVHLRSDLFSAFDFDIQEQILQPFERALSRRHNAIEFSVTPSSPKIPLKSFEVKPFKTNSSSVLKLIARPDRVTGNIYDKIGVRFVTETKPDAMYLLAQLFESELVSFPNIMPEQSHNTLVDIPDFEEGLRAGGLLSADSGKHAHPDPDNQFSGPGYKFIKFINRKLITVLLAGDRKFQFFYPFEIQILDAEAALNSGKDQNSHSAYKERQRLAARNRLFPNGLVRA